MQVERGGRVSFLWTVHDTVVGCPSPGANGGGSEGA
jgi:hypothetical protein